MIIAAPAIGVVVAVPAAIGLAIIRRGRDTEPTVTIPVNLDFGAVRTGQTLHIALAAMMTQETTASNPWLARHVHVVVHFA